MSIETHYNRDIEEGTEHLDEQQNAFGPEDDLALLREAIADMIAGRGRPFDEAMREIAAERGLPWPPQG